jgi:tRNA(adenine34) deaminase
MALTDFSDEHFMKQALKEAQSALAKDEVPVGAVIVSNNVIIARGHNLTEQLLDVTAHAEMQAITSAANHIGVKYLNQCTLYVTIEPCIMCAGALFWSQIGKVVYGATDEKRGASTTGKNLFHPKTIVTGGIMAEECGQLLSDFFKSKRNKPENE